MKLSTKDLLLILLVVVVWGLNFVAIKVGLDGAPPFLLGVLRFSVLLFPAFFVPLPKVKFHWLLAYGLTINFGQFAFMFSAIDMGMPVGLTSLVMQSQAFFTLIMAAILLKEGLRLNNVIGLLIALFGLMLIAADVGEHAPVIALFFNLLGALSWAIGNILIKQMKGVNLLSLTVWGGVVSIPFFVVSSLWLEGAHNFTYTLTHLSMTTMIAVFYLGFIATVVGYGLWGQMLTKYPASLIAPFSLLVPVLGMGSSVLVLGETLSGLEIIGSAIIMAGLCVNVFATNLDTHLRGVFVGKDDKK